MSGTAGLPAAGALAWFRWWLVSDALSQARKRKAAIAVARRYRHARDDMGKHDGHHDSAVTVAALLARAAEAGRALHLNWGNDDTDPQGFAAVHADDWPTGVLPRITDGIREPMDSTAVEATADSVAELPQRPRDTAIPEPDRPVWVERDEALLSRLLDGLNRLG